MRVHQFCWFVRVFLSWCAPAGDVCASRTACAAAGLLLKDKKTPPSRYVFIDLGTIISILLNNRGTTLIASLHQGRLSLVCQTPEWYSQSGFTAALSAYGLLSVRLLRPATGSFTVWILNYHNILNAVGSVVKGKYQSFWFSQLYFAWHFLIVNVVCK